MPPSRPSDHVRSARRPSAGRQPSGPSVRSRVPSQAIAKRPLGSTMGRQTAPTDRSSRDAGSIGDTDRIRSARLAVGGTAHDRSITRPGCEVRGLIARQALGSGVTDAPDVDVRTARPIAGPRREGEPATVCGVGRDSRRRPRCRSRSRDWLPSLTAWPRGRRRRRALDDHGRRRAVGRLGAVDWRGGRVGAGRWRRRFGARRCRAGGRGGSVSGSWTITTWSPASGVFEIATACRRDGDPITVRGVLVRPSAVGGLARDRRAVRRALLGADLLDLVGREPHAPGSVVDHLDIARPDGGTALPRLPGSAGEG